MSTMVPNRLTRVQVQEKFKRNFQALCARCPQLGKNQDTLDDSLTSLQWLSNLNVNISNPMEQCNKNGPLQRNGGLLPSFPRNFDGHDSNISLYPNADLPKNLSTPVKVEFDSKNAGFYPTKPNFIKPGSHTTNNTRGLPRNGRKTSAHTIGRPFAPQTDPPGRSQSSSASTLKMYRRALSNPLQDTTRHASGFNGEVQELSRPDNHFVNKDTANHQSNETNQIQIEPTQTSHLPQIQIANLKPQEDNESILSEVASVSRHYSFSPRETTLDLLPGQVDYKNNPYVKPAFSFTTLICMAMQSSKRHRMTLPAICKWITDNFMYYRYADPGWQNSIKLNLTQSKYFTKVHKKKESTSKNCLWEINKSCNIKLRDMNSPIMNGNATNNSPRLEPVTTQLSSTNVASSVQALAKIEQEDAITLASRKRKQSSPQKVIRRRSANAKKRRDNIKSAGNRNLLQEQAPELGSLKGDFNWNTIFDEFFGTTEAELSVTPTSLASRPSTNEGNEPHDIISQFSDDVVSGSLLAHDMLILPDVPESAVNDENHESSSSLASCKLVPSWQSVNDRAVQPVDDNGTMSNSLKSSSELPLIQDCDLDFEDKDEDELNSIDGFLKDVGELDLTVTGRQIEPPPEWIPVCPDLDAILCEKQNDNMFENPPSSSDLDRMFSSSSSTQSNPDQYLSPRRNTARSRKPRKSGAVFSRNVCNKSPQGVATISPTPPRRPWQEVKDATETIANLLSSNF